MTRFTRSLSTAALFFAVAGVGTASASSAQANGAATESKCHSVRVQIDTEAGVKARIDIDVPTCKGINGWE